MKLIRTGIVCNNEREKQDIINFFNSLYDKNTSSAEVCFLLGRCLRHPLTCQNEENKESDNERLRDILHSAIVNHERYDVIQHLAEESILSKKDNFVKKPKMSHNPYVFLSPATSPSAFTQHSYKEASALMTQLVLKSLLDNKFSLSLDPPISVYLMAPSENYKKSDHEHIYLYKKDRSFFFI